ncbi:FMN-dependent NADH-azoreductase [Pseudohalocynthiibacter aestuariivivens]|jgi:FMN-dependent NADH-azoreductase|uniref:FMN dependent NADH:quinone oxidoreductase n=1 Tax=Pseudohalocynthiibacter aestuariivivens TaxID=1591409 RepID=A0ABV5JBJ8_9RHOB|nr:MULTISPECIES: NAD(P)H-dependent oxidoreductase [Pseudohalocynthiibacter]MBS9715613.1 NAD(P)H-dependent oxidoreductase [Pseudohalocynthiibacter aestuariivivens]MCK0101227.1 NAD(P)H-dependent oxidoreductase [Pseudohalocynthiibacter sp. F2068]
MSQSILRIDASARTEDSVSRSLTDSIVARFGGATVITRDLSEGIPHLSETWVGATFTPPENRTAQQAEALSFSDELVAEIKAADIIVIGSAVYNFSLPSSLKAWIDQISRVGVTFKYGENSPEGLLKDKRVIVALASGGTAIGSDYDHFTPYLKFVLGFLGITDVQFVGATELAQNADASIVAAKTEIGKLAA